MDTATGEQRLLAGDSWALGSGRSSCTVRADAVEYMRCLAGRNNAPAVVADDDGAANAAVAARVVF
ncbi:MAG: hypothetical protein GEU74_04825 [Nitriliruptorales bacterium]|nr:hypothetical protein [Nitriliruptorales bacterium]